MPISVGKDLTHPVTSAIRDLLADQLKMLDTQLKTADELSTLGSNSNQSYINALEGFAGDVDNYLKRLASFRKKDCNALLPIHSLPRELFVDILTKVQGSSFGPMSRTVIGWTSVCSVWRDAIIASANLWRSIDLGLHSELLTLVLSRSGSRPLVLQWDDGRSLTEQGCSLRVQNALKLLTSSRCRRLHSTTQSAVVAETSLKHYGAHAVNIYLSGGNRPPPVDRNPILSNSPGPGIHSLILKQFKLARESWSSPRLSDLQLLCIRGSSELPSDRQMYEMLSAASQLSFLVLSLHHDSESTSEVPLEDLPASTPTLHLPQLKLIRFQDTPRRLNRLLLTFALCPNCQQLMFDSLDSSHLPESTNLFWSLTPRALPLHSIVATVYTDYVSIYDTNSLSSEVWPKEYRDLLPEARPSVDVSVDVEGNNGLLRTLNSLNDLLSYMLKLSVMSQIPPSIVFDYQAGAWRSLVHLELTTETPNMITFLYHLGQRPETPPDASSARSPLPNLFYLDLNLEDNPGTFMLDFVADIVASMAATRYYDPPIQFRAINGTTLPHLCIRCREELKNPLRSKHLPGISLDGPFDIPLEDLVQH